METPQVVAVDEQLRAWLTSGVYHPALTLLTETYLQSIFRYCLRMCQGQTALAEEITQETFAAACRSITQFRGEASAKTWLFAIAHHQTLRALGRQRRQATLQQLSPQTKQAQVSMALSPAPEDSAGIHDDVARLRVALTQAGLAPVDRSIVLLRFGIDVPQALSVAEIATMLGLSRDTVYRRLKHTLDQLRRIMDDDLDSRGSLSRHGLVGDGAVAPCGPGRALATDVARPRAGTDRGPCGGRAVRPGTAAPRGRTRHPRSGLL
jgi:RNA polymerase sigma-70 factor (ECF subfamily)